MDVVHESPESLPPPWSLIEFNFSNQETDSEFVFMCNYRQFILSVSADSFSQSPALKDKYLFFLEVAKNFELDGYTVEDLYDWIAEPLLPKFKQLPDVPTPLTLQHFLFPESYKYDVQCEGDKLVVVSSDGSDDVAPLFGIRLPEDICAPWPQYDPRDIQLPEKRNSFGPPSYMPSKVFLNNGNGVFFKPMRGGDKKSFLHEIDKYRSIHNAHLDASLRISRLVGLVRTENSQVFGLLLTYIDCGRRTLLCAGRATTPNHLKQRWAEQVHDIVHQLHNSGLIWGDAKPDNVLIDRNNDAWLIDFGGGYTDGWVPKELSGSVEGDLHALQKIYEFLEV